MAELRQPPSVEAYGGGGFRVGGARMDGSVLIVDDSAQVWRPASLAEITPADLAPVLARAAVVELLILGVGPDALPAPRPVREALRAAGLGLEALSTAEACRLYNLLAREGRRVAAALIAV